jgi:hypothetical protein
MPGFLFWCPDFLLGGEFMNYRRVNTEGCRGLPYFDEQKKTRLRSHLSA